MNSFSLLPYSDNMGTSKGHHNLTRRIGFLSASCNNYAKITYLRGGRVWKLPRNWNIRSGRVVLEKDAFHAPPLAAHLASLLRVHNMTVQDVILRCNLDSSYAYQMFNGTRTPTRKFLLRLAFLLLETLHT